MAPFRSLFLLITTSLIGLLAGPACAQDWPAGRPLIMVIPFAAGGPTDVIGRVMAPAMSEVLHQQIVIENVGGAGGMLGSARIARAAPDGHQFVLGGLGTFVLNQLLYKKPPFDTTTDLAPVALVADQPQVLLTRKDFPAADLREFVAHARATPTLLYGSAGAGSASHACAILLNAAMGTKLVHVPFRGGAPAMQELLGGRTDFQCELIATALPQIRARTVKTIAALTRERIAVLPDLPTAREQGLADVEAEPWFGFFLPGATPEPIVRKLNEAVVTAMNTPAVRERMVSLGVLLVAPERRSPGYLAEFVKHEIAKWSGPVKASGVVLD